MSKAFLLLLTLGVSFSATAETLFIQTAASQTPHFPDTSRLVVAGINDEPILTLNGPAVVSELYAITIQETAGTVSNGSENMTDNITLVEDPVSGPNALVTNPFGITQSFTETGSGRSAIFAALAGSTFIVPLTTGRFLLITPLANANLSSNDVVNADFQLLSSVPEPSSILSVAAALLALISLTRNRRAASPPNRS
jgi:hypothetical protein